MKGRLVAMFVVLSLLAVACGQVVVSGSEDVTPSTSQAASDPPSAEFVPSETTLSSQAATVPGDDDSQEKEVSESTSSSTQPAPGVPSESKPAPATTEPASGETTDTVPSSVAESAPVMSAKADLADRLGVDVSTITVVLVEEVDWPDGSLGCPQPGMRYTQAIVNGMRIVLVVNGTAYEYHSGGSRDPFYCPNPTEPAPSTGK